MMETFFEHNSNTAYGLNDDRKSEDASFMREAISSFTTCRRTWK